MEDKEKIEFERAKLRNYILEKENEMLMGKIGALSNEKVELLAEIQRFKEAKDCKTKNRLKNMLKKIMGRK